jgi:hypothetical protein
MPVIMQQMVHRFIRHHQTAMTVNHTQRNRGRIVDGFQLQDTLAKGGNVAVNTTVATEFTLFIEERIPLVSSTTIRPSARWLRFTNPRKRPFFLHDFHKGASHTLGFAWRHKIEQRLTNHL